MSLARREEEREEGREGREGGKETKRVHNKASDREWNTVQKESANNGGCHCCSRARGLTADGIRQEEKQQTRTLSLAASARREGMARTSSAADGQRA